MAKKLEEAILTFGTSTSTLPSSLLSAVDDGHSSIARTSLADSTTSRVSFTLDSTLDSVNKIEQTAEQYAQRAGFDEDTIPHIAMAVREAAVNAVLHGNAYDVNKHITASFETTSDSTGYPHHRPGTRASIQTPFPTLWRRKISCEAQAEASF